MERNARTTTPSHSSLPLDDSSLAISVFDLLRHYARQGRYDDSLLGAIAETQGDLATLFADGLALKAQRLNEDERFPALVRLLPEMWRIDLDTGLRTVLAVAARLSTEFSDRLHADSLRLIRRLDSGPRPAAWEGVADIFTSLVREPTDEDERHDGRARVIARGVTLAVLQRPDALAPVVTLVDAIPSRALLRGLAREDALLTEPRWIASLLLRGGAHAMALAAASLVFAPAETLVRLRNILAVAPPRSLVRAAEAYGLLTLSGEMGQDAAESLRTALLTQAWQGTDLSGLPWRRAFRGECLVASSLDELGRPAEVLARDVAAGLPHHLGADDALGDPERRSAIAQCLAYVMAREPRYSAPMRLADSRLRDLNRYRGSAGSAQPLQRYVALLVETARLLLPHEQHRTAALKLYAQVLRLRSAHPRHLPPELLPDTVESVLHIGSPERAARRWLTREVKALYEDRDAVEGPLPTPEDPLPTARGVVTTAEGIAPLPKSVASWIGAPRRWSLGRLLSGFIPLPFRHLAASFRRLLGLAPKARFVMTDDGGAAMTVRRRYFGLSGGARRRGIPAGKLLTFPEGNARADGLLARWTGVLLVSVTIGAYYVLEGLRHDAALAVVAGSAAAVIGLIGYLGALRLHRVVGQGNAVVARDDEGHLTVWRVDPETRHVLLSPPQPEVR